VAPDLSLSHTVQTAMAPVPEPRLEELAQIYQPKKVTAAALEIVDTPGLSPTREGNAARLALIREAGCLVLVVAAFDGSDPATDLNSFEEDLMLADMEILSGRIQRVEEALKKPLPRQEHEQLVHEEEVLKVVLAAMEDGKPLRESQMSGEQLKATRSFRLLSEKPRMVVVNLADDEEHPDGFTGSLPHEIPVVGIPVGLELELARMEPEDRAEFEEEMGVGGADRDQLIRSIMDAAGQILFFTSNKNEVRSWLLRRGGTALEAAGTVHTDMARGFIRAEVTSAADLIRLGSPREVKAQHLMHQESKDYVVQPDDVLLIRFSV
jgi:ribosome-binding ATPase YchF (GTP1/OBG family)